MHASCFAGVVLATVAAAQSEPVRVANTTELRHALARATPGTTLVLAAGDYEGIAASGVSGTAAAPIVLRAERRSEPPRFQTGIHLTDLAHVEIDGLLVTGAAGNGINIDDGGTFTTPSHHVILRHVTVRDIGGDGNHDGIKLSGVTDFDILDCTIERWGRGGSAIDMVGCQRGRIDGCTMRDRQSGGAANGVQMKGGTRDVIVRACHFEHAGERAVQLGGSTGRDYFRPAPEGFEARDLIVEGCTFVGSTAPIAFVGCDGGTVRCNTLYLPGKWALRILQETRGDFTPCRNGVFVDNLIVYRGLDSLVNVGPDTAPASFAFARNYWFRIDAPHRSMPPLPTAETDGAGGEDPGLIAPASGDLRLRADSPARGRGAEALRPAGAQGK